MYQLQYIVPDTFPPVKGALDKEVAAMCSKLKGVDEKGAQVPNSALSVQIIVTLDGATLEIRKRGQLVYVNVFCFDTSHFPNLFDLVERFYLQYGLGIPKRPKIPTWIHSIPVAHGVLRENEIILCQKMTVSFYWAAFAQHLKRSNTMN